MGGYNTQAIRHWLKDNIDAKWIQAERFFHVHADADLDADTLGELAACGASVSVADTGDVFVIGPDDVDCDDDAGTERTVAQTAAGFPDPEEYAEELRESAEEDGRGVALDTLTDGRLESGQHKYLLRRVTTDLDMVCDDLGLLPDDVVTMVRRNQHELRAAYRWVDVFESALTNEIAALTSDE